METWKIAVLTVVAALAFRYWYAMREGFCVNRTIPLNDVRPGHTEVGYVALQGPRRMYIRGYLPIIHSDPYFNRRGQFYSAELEMKQGKVRKLGKLGYSRNRFYDKSVTLSKKYSPADKLVVYAHLRHGKKEKVFEQNLDFST